MGESLALKLIDLSLYEMINELIYDSYSDLAILVGFDMDAYLASVSFSEQIISNITIGLDYSYYDGRQNTTITALRYAINHFIIINKFIGRQKNVALLHNLKKSSLMIIKIIKTKQQENIYMKGCQSSGDVQTTAGNSELNIMLLNKISPLTYLSSNLTDNKEPSATYMCQGDDGRINSQQEVSVSEMSERADNVGMLISKEKIEKSIWLDTPIEILSHSWRLSTLIINNVTFNSPTSNRSMEKFLAKLAYNVANTPVSDVNRISSIASKCISYMWSYWSIPEVVIVLLIILSHFKGIINIDVSKLDRDAKWFMKVNNIPFPTELETIKPIKKYFNYEGEIKKLILKQDTRFRDPKLITVIQEMLNTSSVNQQNIGVPNICVLQNIRQLSNNLIMNNTMDYLFA